MDTLKATIVSAEKSCRAISTKKNEPPQKMDKTTIISHSLVAIEVSMFDVIKKSSYQLRFVLVFFTLIGITDVHLLFRRFLTLILLNKNYQRL